MYVGNTERKYNCHLKSQLTLNKTKKSNFMQFDISFYQTKLNL